jgi:hypothetical protein
VCKAQKIINRLKGIKPLTPPELIEVEISLQECMVTCDKYKRAFKERMRLIKVAEDALCHPTTQEQNHRALK